MNSRGLFITVEGGEGVGKSTNVELLANYLREHDVDVLVTREPGGTTLGEDIRNVLLQERQQAVDPMAELLLIFAARAQHLHECIEPALTRGTWVLCDRFTDATYAYQSGGRGLNTSTVRTLEDLVQGTLRPDYTLLLDVDVQTGMSRARGRGALDRIEQETMDFFERVRARYLQLAECGSGRYRVVDAGAPLEDVQQQVLTVASELLDCWRVRHQA